MKKIISFLLVIVMLFSVSACSIVDSSVNKLNQLSELDLLIQEYNKAPTDELLGEIIAVSVDKLDFAVLQKYGKEFFSENNDTSYASFGAKINKKLPETGKSESENTAVLYDASLCMYILSYTYDLETDELIYDYQKMLSIYEDNKHLFKDREYYLNCLIAYADYFNKADELKQFVLSAFGVYLLNCEAEEKMEIINFLSTEYTFLAKTDLHSLYFSMFSVGNINDEPLSDAHESEGIIPAKSISDIISISDRIVLTNTSGLDDLKDEFGIYPKTLQTESFYTHLYYTDEYIIAFYGNPVFSVTVYDIATSELVYYHSKTIDGYYIKSSEQSQSDKTG